MPRWKALPDEFDPQVKEFAVQLRRLVDRSGLSISAVADRTGYSKTSWERYLNGRLLAPKGAIVALAEVTGTNPVHLTTMWELAERAWSRSEMRHDMTMEAIRISQARAALAEPGAAPGAAPETKDRAGKAARSATATPGVAGPAGVVPAVPPQPVTAVPPQPTAAESADAESDVPASRGSATGRNSWGLAGYMGPSGTGARPDVAAQPSAAPTDGPGRAPGAPGDFGPATAGGPAGEGRPDGGDSSDASKRRLTMFLAGVVGALVVIAVVFFVTGGGDKKPVSAPKPSATAPSVNPDLPAGVKCSGASCTGKDPEHMGCGGTLATTTTSVTVGTTLVEVRYSKTCGAAWARITRAAQGDTVEVSAGGAGRQSGSVAARQTGSVTAPADTDAYTPMLAVKDGAAAKACVALSSGQKGCTK